MKPDPSPSVDKSRLVAIAEAIVREHEDFCVGHYDTVAPWCSCAPHGTPLCRACEKLANAIAFALQKEHPSPFVPASVERTDTLKFDTTAMARPTVDALEKVFRWTADFELSKALRSELTAAIASYGDMLVAALSRGSASPPPTPGVTVSEGALAGLRDALGGDSGALRIELGQHEIMDMALSGQAYSLDGRYNFQMKDGSLADLWERGSASPPEEPQIDLLLREVSRLEAALDQCVEDARKIADRAQDASATVGRIQRGYRLKGSASGACPPRPKD